MTICPTAVEDIPEKQILHLFIHFVMLGDVSRIVERPGIEIEFYNRQAANGGAAFLRGARLGGFNRGQDKGSPIDDRRKMLT